MKQEEDNKIAAAAATMSQIEYLRSGELEQVVEEEEEYGDDDELMMGGNQQGGGEQEGKEQGSQSGAETASGGESGFPSERASGHVRSISASSVSSVSSTSSVRTAKAERRLKERLSQEVIFIFYMFVKKNSCLIKITLNCIALLIIVGPISFRCDYVLGYESIGTKSFAS